MSFETKDSGERMQFSSGMQRDTTTGKTDYSLVYDGPMLQRWAELDTRGAVKYEARNWMKAAGQAELDRFKASAARHFAQWMRGDTDEDHGAAVFFNINGAEYVKEKLAPVERREDNLPATVPPVRPHGNEETAPRKTLQAQRGGVWWCPGLCHQCDEEWDELSLEDKQKELA